MWLVSVNNRVSFQLAVPLGDGVSDGDEVTPRAISGHSLNGVDGFAPLAAGGQDGPISNPVDPSDEGDPANCVTVRLTVGDSSGSNSERWIMEIRENVLAARSFNHCDAGFGTPGSKSYPLTKGKTYVFKLKWVDTNLEYDDRKFPDFDWRCLINDSAEKGARAALHSTGSIIVEDPDGLLTIETHGNDEDITIDKEIKIRVSKLTLESAYSDQLPDREANPLPPVNGQSTMYMGARSDNRGYLRINATVQPSRHDGWAFVGVRRHNTSTVLASVPIAEDGETRIDFPPGGSLMRYEVVAGVDLNADGELQNSEVAETLPNQFVLVTQADYNSADDYLEEMETPLLPAATSLLNAFRTGLTPQQAISTGRLLFSTQLTHPVGAVWDSENRVTVANYTFHENTYVADAVARAPQTLAAAQGHLGSAAQKDIINAYFEQNPSILESTFGPWPWPATLVFFATDPSLLLAFGHVQISGRMWVTVRRADLSVSAIEYEGSFTDLYDFNHTDPAPASTAAKVQTGFPTLGNAGNVFFDTVNFRRKTSDIIYRFQ